jgi:hypothetical protein
VTYRLRTLVPSPFILVLLLDPTVSDLAPRNEAIVSSRTGRQLLLCGSGVCNIPPTLETAVRELPTRTLALTGPSRFRLPTAAPYKPISKLQTVEPVTASHRVHLGKVR